MPVRTPSNNSVLPANARASDVAARAVEILAPAQQHKTMNALRVQGYAGVFYNRLTQGRRCTCQASQKVLNYRLDKDGKASPGLVNQLLTGDLSFDVSPYGSKTRDDVYTDEVSPLAPVNKNQGVFDVVARNAEAYPNARVPDGPTFGDNGPLDPDVDIEALVGGFDASHVGFSDATCGICFGHGFIGGYAPFQANRQVVTVADVDLSIDGVSAIDYSAAPWTAESKSFEFTTVLPLGAVNLDVFRVMNNHLPVPANFTIDSTPATAATVLQKCDGRRHVIRVALPLTNVWTHVEIQLVLTNQSTYFEFPKLSKGSDTSLLEQLEPFSIILGPNVPSVKPQDVFVDSTFGKVLIVQNSSGWNTRGRNVLGWECSVRVIQPAEIYRILPGRGRTLTKNKSTNPVHDNARGRS